MTSAAWRVLVLNVGSSTLKWTVLGAVDPTPVAGGTLPWTAAGGESALAAVLAAVPRVDAVGHRVVHGGLRFRDAVQIDATVREALAALVDLDPLHMPPALAAIDAVRAAFPSLPQVAVFDTAFHATLPEAATGYGLPHEWAAAYGARRYGFHGLSVDHATAASAAILGGVPPRSVVCHLGSGCSVTAVADGRSVDTTMGFSPLEGVMMATRAGSVDPGLLLHLQLRHAMTPQALRDALIERSGLLGVSGISGDLREVEAAMDAGDARARLAYERFVLSVRRAMGQMTGVLGGIDALVLTGGIGEHDPRVRRDAVAAVDGARLDDARNQTAAADGNLAAAGSVIPIVMICAREDLVVRREALRLHDRA